MADDEVKGRSGRAGTWRPRIVIGTLAAAAIAATIWGIATVAGGRSTFDAGSTPTYTVTRGKLDITVLEGGSVEALESQEIRSEVKGYQGTKILSIVEEGYRVNEDDVTNAKLLVELDSSELDDKLKNQLIQIESTAASLIEAQKSYEIQINQNESDIQTAALETRFARMDLQKYLGAELTDRILAESRIMERLQEEEASASASTERPASEPPAAAGAEDGLVQTEQLAIAAPPETDEPTVTPAGSATPSGSETAPALRVEMGSSATARHEYVDFSKYAEVELLGDGEARQKLRELEDKLLVAREELSIAESELEATERLVAKEFETQRELENKRLTVEKHRISGAAAETAKKLFETYEFPKEAEKLLSDYIEKMRKLQRTEKEAQSKLAQAEAKLRSAEARFEIESQQVKELKEQISKCKISAQRTGLVVYGGNERGWYGEERIQEGATVRERQMIITIPDMTKMSVKVKIHESDIKKVGVGQKASIRVDAFPDIKLDGEVIKVGVLPDAEQRWMNPDLKVYETSIRIDGVYDWLKPGMSAQTEIMISTVDDVLFVPVQAVHASGDDRVCYVSTPTGPRRQVVSTGQFTDKFIEVQEGLTEGEVVYLVAPDGMREPEPAPKPGEPVTPNEAPVDSGAEMTAEIAAAPTS